MLGESSIRFTIHLGMIVPDLLVNHLGFSQCGVVLLNYLDCQKLQCLDCLLEGTPVKLEQLYKLSVEYKYKS